MDVERTPLGVRFTRWMLNSVPPPTYVKAVGFQGRIDRCQRFEFVAPGSVLQWTGATDAGGYRDGDTSDSKLAFRLYHGLTPETDTSCFYFWSAASGFRQDEPAATEQFFDQVAAAFLEDKTMVEAQQARLSELGEGRWWTSPAIRSALLCVAHGTAAAEEGNKRSRRSSAQASSRSSRSLMASAATVNGLAIS